MHIVLCGYPRSGTTLLYNMLRSTVINFSFYDREISFLNEEVMKGINLITKKPMDIKYVGLADRSKIKFIVMIRDPRSVLCSKHWQAPDMYKVSWDWAIKTAVNGEVVRMRGLLWMDRLISFIENPVLVKFEDLVKDYRNIQTYLGDLFGLEYAGDFCDFYKTPIPKLLSLQLNGVRPIDESRIDSWKTFPERIKEQFTACPELHALLYKYGYEQNQEWFNEL
jgi:hypothetical protein